MSTPGLYADISKTIDDHFKKGHVLGENKFTLKSKASNGAQFNAESKITKDK